LHKKHASPKIIRNLKHIILKETYMKLHNLAIINIIVSIAAVLLMMHTDISHFYAIHYVAIAFACGMISAALHVVLRYFLQQRNTL